MHHVFIKKNIELIVLMKNLQANLVTKKYQI